MRRALAAAGTALLLACGLGACSDDGGVKAESSEPSAEVPETDLPTDLPTEIPTDLPTEIPTGLPTETESEVAPSGAGVDACSIVTPELVQSTFGIGDPGQVLPQPASLGDPDSTDCYFVGDEATIVVQATSRADQDLPESSYSYAGLPGAVEVPGADRGWAFVFPGQSGDTLVSGLILVKGQNGMNFSITINGHPYDNDTLLAFAEDVLAGL